MATNLKNAATDPAKAEPMFFATIRAKKLTYAKGVDNSPVDQVGFVDLHKAFLTSTVPGDLMVDEKGYNGVDDPASLIGRPSDVFDAIRKGQAVQKSSAAAAEAAAASSAETE